MSAIRGDRLRILYARNLVRPSDLGGNRYPFEVVARLAARGHDVRVVSSSQIEVPNVRLTRYRAFRSNPAFTFGSHAFLGRISIDRVVRSWTPDVIVLSSYDTAFGYFWPTRRRTIPTVFIYHSRFHSDAVNRVLDGGSVVQRMAAPALGRLASVVQRMPLRLCDECVAVSEFSRNEIESYGRTDRIQVVSTGVDTTKFAPGDRDAARLELGIGREDRMLLTVGRLVPVKRYDRAIRALAILRRESTHIEWRLHIAGTGSDYDGLRELAARQGVADRVVFEGQLDGDALLQRLHAADAQLCTSDFENWSLSILEGLATGLPVVGTPTGGTPDLLRQVDPRLVLAGLEPDDVARGVRSLLESGDIAEIRRRCRQAAERFSWDRVVEDLEAVFKKARASR